MKIAHVVSTFPPYRGGQGNVAAEIAERTRAGGHEVVVVTPQSFRPWLRFGNAAWCPDITRELERVRPDIVHFHWPFIGGLAPVLNYSSTRRLVVQYHMDLIGSGWRGAVFAAYQRRTLPHLLATADRVVVSSLDYARHGALAPYVAGLSDRLIEIPIGVDVGRFSPSPREGEREGVGTYSALFVGGLDRAHAFKGVEVLLKAIALLGGCQAPSLEKVPGTIFLRIVGDGDLRSSYEQQARDLGIADRVEFLGAVSDADLPNIYRSADCLVLPSTTRSEAFGLVLLEAMASGIPVIASDLPGVRTVVADGESGFLVPPGDAQSLAARCSALARDHALRERMGIASRRRVVERYGWEMIVRQWVATYASVIRDL